MPDWELVKLDRRRKLHQLKHNRMPIYGYCLGWHKFLYPGFTVACLSLYGAHRDRMPDSSYNAVCECGFLYSNNNTRWQR